MKRYIVPELTICPVDETCIMAASPQVDDIPVDPDDEGPFNAKSAGQSDVSSAEWQDED